MKKVQFAAVLALTVCALRSAPAFAQASPSDPQTLENILRELKAIHATLRVNQSCQILLTEWQLQQAQVNRATERRDNLRVELTGVQTEEAHDKSQLSRLEDALSESTLEPGKRSQFLDGQEHFRTEITTLKGKDLALSDELADAEAKLKTEQGKLDGIQSDLDAIMQQLRAVPRS